MSARLITNIRQGQAILSDELLAEQVTISGMVSAPDVAAALEVAEPGQFGAKLVDDGVLSHAQLATLASAVEMQESLETVAGSDAPAEVEAASLELDRRIGRYVLVEEIGAGGMGVVWKAWDTPLSRWVAIKLVKVRDAQLVRRFMQEARLLARLGHPNVTQVFEVGVHEGRPFLAMELVNGVPPESANGMDRQRAAAIVRDAARGVHFAHEQGIIHRDLKPSNLLVADNGRVFVTDFGLARMREEGAGLTQSGALLGTPSFMAPEQAQGRDACERTDIYGLGATLYAMVAGEPPHTGEIVHEIVKRVAVANPPTLVGDDDLVVIVQKAMERDREDRYTTAAEFADDLQRYIDDEPIMARPMSSLARGWRRARRRPVYSASIAATLLVLVAVLATGGSALWQQAERRAEIRDAADPLANGDGIITEVERMHAFDDYEASWENAALKSLEQYVDDALQAAPGYAPALYQQGRLRIWRDDTAGAIESFDAALQDQPDFHEARALRAGLWLIATPDASPTALMDVDGFRIVPPERTPELDALIAKVEAELDVLPAQFSRRQMVEAILNATKGDFETGAAGLEAYLDERPFDLQARSQLPWSQLGLGRFAAAQQTTEDVLKRGRMPATMHFVRAFALAGQGDVAAAFDAMIASDAVQKSADTQQWAAFFLGRLGLFAESLQVYNKALDTDPTHFNALVGRANTLNILGRFDTALPDAEAAIAMQPDNAYAHFLLAGALVQSDPGRALLEYDRAVELDPTYTDDVLRMRGGLLVNAGRLDEAVAAFERALDFNPEATGVRDLLARTHLMRSDAAAVRLLYQNVTKSADDYMMLAQAERIAGNEAAALDQLALALELRPDDLALRAEQARQHRRLGNEAAATAAFDAAYATTPDNEVVYEAEAWSWFDIDAYPSLDATLTRWRQAHPDSDGPATFAGWLNAADGEPQ
ncbi:MAG: protein kinase [Pseudomonadota bacterium]